jgi:two-component system, NarL family, sensor kinase
LSADEQAAVFRIVQELLRNVVQHARASHVELALRKSDDAVLVTVVDDGVGFDPAQAAAEGHFGLRLINDVAAAVGTGLQVRTAPDRGTAWRITVPTR